MCRLGFGCLFFRKGFFVFCNSACGARPQPDDLEALQDLLATRLVKSIGGLHFQVAERTLCLWNR
jgi:hypothetical protein